MKRLTVILLISGFTMAVACSSGPSLRTVKPIDYEKRMLVAVSDIQNLTGNKDYDPFMEGLTGGLTAELHEVNCFRVIERQRLISILEEIKLSMEGLTDPAVAREVGKMAGAEAILFVNLLSVQYSSEKNWAFFAEGTEEKIETIMDARLVAVKTGETFAVSKISIPATNRYINSLFSKVGGKADQKVIVQKNLEKSIEYLAREVAWQVSKKSR
jgi:curli biogenesis system outer membrane secretion channel CsgG